MASGFARARRFILFAVFLAIGGARATVHNDRPYSDFLPPNLDHPCGGLVTGYGVPFDEGESIPLADSPFLICNPLTSSYRVSFIGFDWRGGLRRNEYVDLVRNFAANRGKNVISLSRMIDGHKLTFKAEQSPTASPRWLMVTVGQEAGPEPLSSKVIIFHALPPDCYGFMTVELLLIELAFGNMIAFGSPVPKIKGFSPYRVRNESEQYGPDLGLHEQASYEERARAFVNSANRWSTLRLYMDPKVTRADPSAEYFSLMDEAVARVARTDEGIFIVSFRPMYRQNTEKHPKMRTPLEIFFRGLRFDGPERSAPPKP